MKWFAAAFVLLTLVAGCSHRSSPSAAEWGGETWTHAGFEQFVRGTFGDAGANTYVSSDGRIQSINRWDLDDDGNLDLVFTNSHRHAEKLDAVIYWGNGKDYDGSRISYVPNNGSENIVAADLNDDGRMDAVVANYTNGTWSKMPSAVYYGGEVQPAESGSEQWGFPPFARKQTLPTEAAQNAAVGDLNRDGFQDIVFAQSAGFWEYRGGDALASPSRIYWGSKDGYAADHFTDIEASGASDVAIADLNKDEWPDLVIANRERDGKTDVDSFVYWGGKDGLAPERRSELPTRQANAVTVADVNGDDYADILFANGAGLASYVYLSDAGRLDRARRIELPTSDARDCEVADLNGDGRADAVFTSHQTAANWLTTSFIYFGNAQIFSLEDRQELETVGASGVSLADLNGDERVDIVISNFQEHHSFDVPSYIYWNSPDGFAMTLRTSLFTHGAVGNTVADFNGDGHLDLLFNNTKSRQRGGVTPSFVYFGNDRGRFNTERRLELPAVEPYDWAAADLNEDGRTDLILANLAETGRRVTESFIYWGNPDGFSPAHRSALMGEGGRGAGVADFDRDGYLDIVLYNNQPATIGGFIYWGSPAGYVTTERTALPVLNAGLPTLADLNADGHLDIIVHGDPKTGSSILWGDGTRGYGIERRTIIPDSVGSTNSEVADLNRDGHLDVILVRRNGDMSFIYYGSADHTYSTDRRAEFGPLELPGVTVGDVNKDGWLDIACPNYKDQGSRRTLSRVYLGTPNGFSDESSFDLPTYAGTGSQIADYNRDGYNDILFICHRGEGDADRIGAVSDHITDSFLYWGGPDGFRADRRLEIPGEGPHLDGGVDLGNIRDRSFHFDYISPPHQAQASDARPAWIDWSARTPGETSVKFQIRSADTEAALAGAPWRGPRGEGSFFTKGGTRIPPRAGDGGWVQYRAVLTSGNGSSSPALSSVTIGFAANR